MTRLRLGLIVSAVFALALACRRTIVKPAPIANSGIKKSCSNLALADLEPTKVSDADLKAHAPQTVTMGLASSKGPYVSLIPTTDDLGYYTLPNSKANSATATLASGTESSTQPVASQDANIVLTTIHKYAIVAGSCQNQFIFPDDANQVDYTFGDNEFPVPQWALDQATKAKKPINIAVYTQPCSCTNTSSSAPSSNVDKMNNVYCSNSVAPSCNVITVSPNQNFASDIAAKADAMKNLADSLHETYQNHNTVAYFCGYETAVMLTNGTLDDFYTQADLANVAKKLPAANLASDPCSVIAPGGSSNNSSDGSGSTTDTSSTDTNTVASATGASGHIPTVGTAGATSGSSGKPYVYTAANNVPGSNIVSTVMLVLGLGALAMAAWHGHDFYKLHVATSTIAKMRDDLNKVASATDKISAWKDILKMPNATDAEVIKKAKEVYLKRGANALTDVLAYNKKIGTEASKQDISKGGLRYPGDTGPAAVEKGIKALFSCEAFLPPTDPDFKSLGPSVDVTKLQADFFENALSLQAQKSKIGGSSLVFGSEKISAGYGSKLAAIGWTAFAAIGVAFGAQGVAALTGDGTTTSNGGGTIDFNWTHAEVEKILPLLQAANATP